MYQTIPYFITHSSIQLVHLLNTIFTIQYNQFVTEKYQQHITDYNLWQDRILIPLTKDRPRPRPVVHVQQGDEPPKEHQQQGNEQPKEQPVVQQHFKPLELSTYFEHIFQTSRICQAISLPLLFNTSNNQMLQVFATSYAAYLSRFNIEIIIKAQVIQVHQLVLYCIKITQNGFIFLIELKCINMMIHVNLFILNVPFVDYKTGHLLTETKLLVKPEGCLSGLGLDNNGLGFLGFSEYDANQLWNDKAEAMTIQLSQICQSFHLNSFIFDFHLLTIFQQIFDQKKKKISKKKKIFQYNKHYKKLKKFILPYHHMLKIL